MEMAGTETVNMPKTYSLNMFKDFVPMCIFSETSQGENCNLCSMLVVVLIHQWQFQNYPLLEQEHGAPCIDIRYLTSCR